MKLNIFYKLIAYLISIPARIKGASFGKNAFIGWGYDFFHISLKGFIVEKNVLIGSNAWVMIFKDKEDATVTIKENTSIGRNVVMACNKQITIGKKCVISYNVSFIDHDHDVFQSLPMSERGIEEILEGKAINIGDNCFIGAHSFILKGVNLGNNSVVGANSVVNKSFPEFSFVAGNPAKLIRKIK